MAVYKLGDISIIKNGTTPSTKDKNLWLKEIPFFGPSDLKNMETKRYITKNKNKLKRSGTTLISSTATIGNVGLLKVESWFNQQITSIEPNNNFLLDKYLYYYFLKNSKKIKNIKGSGSIFTILKIGTFKNWKINLPSLKTQKQIIDIIEPYEKFFLNYSRCLRIDNIKNTKDDLKNLIEIIEPFEIGIKSIEKITFMLKIIRTKIYKATIFKNMKLRDIATAKSGKQPPLSEHINTSNKKYIRFIQNRDYSNYKTKSYISLNFKGTKVDEMDIVIDKYGEPGQMRYGIRGFINVAMLKIIPFKKNYKESIRNHFENEILLKWLKRSSQASTRASLNWNFLKTLNIGLSNNDELLSLFILLELKFKEINHVMKGIKSKIIKILIK